VLALAAGSLGAAAERRVTRHATRAGAAPLYEASHALSRLDSASGEVAWRNDRTGRKWRAPTQAADCLRSCAVSAMAEDAALQAIAAAASSVKCVAAP
jgi:hypothetical protein